MSLKKKSIPYITINRLSIYHRCLEKILETQKEEDLKKAQNVRFKT